MNTYTSVVVAVVAGVKNVYLIGEFYSFSGVALASDKGAGAGLIFYKTAK
jgi:hypothetical protein